MKVARIRNLIADMSDEEEIVCFWYEKAEADDDIENNLSDEYCPEELTQQEWSALVNKMENDDGIAEDLSEAFRYYTIQTLEKRVDNVTSPTNA